MPKACIAVPLQEDAGSGGDTVNKTWKRRFTDAEERRTTFGEADYSIRSGKL
jgi:hypothetical protein